MEIRGASQGFLEYGRWYLAVLLVTGTQPATPAATIPVPIVFSRSRRTRRLVVDIDVTPPCDDREQFTELFAWNGEQVQKIQ
jgi:hypothetical protein